ERYPVEVKGDAERDADAERRSAVAADAVVGAAAIVEVPEPAAHADVERQLERLGGDQRDRVPQIVEVEVEAVARVVVLVDRSETELQRVRLRQEVLATQAERRTELEAEAKRLVRLEAPHVAAT